MKIGDATSAGTDSDVKIQLIGILCDTEPTSLDTAFHNDFEQNETKHYPVTMKDIGEPLVCKIGKLKVKNMVA